MLVFYGSQTGTAQDFAERVGRELSCHLRFRVPVHPMNDINTDALISEKQTIVLICSTTGLGQEPDNMRQFWRYLLKASHPKNLLNNLDYAVFGLGDSSYAEYNFAAKKLDRRLSQLGANRLIERGEGDEQHELGYFASSKQWLSLLYQKLAIDFDNSLPYDTLFQSRYSLRWKNQDVVQEAISSIKSMTLDAYNNCQSFVKIIQDEVYFESVKVVENQRLTPEDYFQNIKQLTLQFKEDLQFMPGDVISVMPSNDPSKVQKLLDLLQWSEIADSRLDIIQNDHVIYQDTTLRDLLSLHLDVFSCPKSHNSLFYYLYHFTSNAEKKLKLKEFTFTQNQTNSSETLQEIYNYLYRPKRNIAEVLIDFEAQIPPEYIMDIFPLMKERDFSISSFNGIKQNQVEITVGIVKYQTILKTPRIGVCTSHLSKLKPGDRVRVRVKKGTFKYNVESTNPLILIGPGIGVAPLRSIWQHINQLKLKRDIYVFVGNRYLDKDSLFDDELRQLQDDGKLKYWRAISRSQSQKVYVQDLLHSQKDLISDLILNQNSDIYLCGNSKRMPSDVKAVITQILAEHIGSNEAELYFKQMIKLKRFQEETWS